MPGFDRTGPMGQGARTGGGWGYCGPGTEATEQVPPLARGLGRGGAPWGGGRGRGRGGGRRGGGYGPPAYDHAVPPYAAPFQQPAWTPEQEVQALQNQASLLEQQLQQIRARMDDLAGQVDADQ